MRTSTIVTRLIDQCPAFSGRVLSALSGAIPTAFPAAYVMPMAERAEPNIMLANAHYQQVSIRFGVEIMVKHAGQANSGGPAHSDLEDLRDAVIAALIGWVPEVGARAIEYSSGQLVQFEAGLAVWREEFTVSAARHDPSTAASS
jgi:hypothetical protein